MAEDFIEEIYQDAIITDKLRECVKIITKGDTRKARNIYNSAVGQIEKILVKYAEADAAKANKLQDTVLEINSNWGNHCVVTGLITGKLIPQMYEYMSAYNDIDVEDNGYELKSSDSGFLTVKKSGTGEFLHDIHDPLEEAGRIADVIYNPKVEEIYLFGTGLGYLPYKIWEISGGAVKVHVYEECKEMITYAFHYGVLSWIEPSSLEVVTEDDENELLIKFMDIVEFDDPGKKIYISSEKRNKYYSAFAGNFEYIAAVLSYSWNLSGTVEINYWKNSKISSVSFDKFKAEMADEEWIVVAAGPSLNYCLDFIKENAGKKKVIAVNTIIKKLEKEGIVPDLVVAADSDEQLVEHIEGVQQYTAQIPIIADIVTNWKFMAKYMGEKCFIYTPSSASYTDSKEDIWDVSGTIASLAIEAAIRLGASKIYLIGLDLAYPGGKQYADGASHKNLSIAKSQMEVLSNDGKMVETVPMFMTFKSVIESIIARNKNIDFYNLSRDGAYIEGTEKLTVEG